MSIIDKVILKSAILSAMQILVINRDRSIGNAYASLLESYGAQVTTVGSIQSALDLLDRHLPAMLIYETNLLDESLDLLLQRVMALARNNERSTSILTLSRRFTQDLPVKIKVYLSSPIEIDPLIYEVWNLVLGLENTHPLNNQNWITKQNLSLTLCCDSPVTNYVD